MSVPVIFSTFVKIRLSLCYVKSTQFNWNGQAVFHLAPNDIIFFCASQPAFEKLLLIQLHLFYSGLETGLASSILEYLYCTT